MISNYEKQVDIGKAHFLKYDQEALSAKFHLDLDKDYIYLTYLNTPARLIAQAELFSKKHRMVLQNVALMKQS